jgi:hypothetical protein
MKFHSVKDWTRKDWGKNALTGILASAAFSMFNVGIVFRVILDLVLLFGVVCFFVWVYLGIRKPKNSAIVKE